MHESEITNKIFISYAHKDFDAVKGYIRYLKDNYFNFWYDKNLVVGDRWRNVIGDQIASSQFFIAFNSTAYQESKFCKKEWEKASEKGETVILSIKIEDGIRGESQYMGVDDVQFFNAVGKTAEEVFAKLQDEVPAIVSCKKDREFLERFQLDEYVPSEGLIEKFLNSKHYDLPLLFSYLFDFLKSCKLQSEREYFKFEKTEVLHVKDSKSYFFKLHEGEACPQNGVGANVQAFIRKLLLNGSGEVYSSFQAAESNHGYVLEKLLGDEYASLSVDGMYKYFTELREALGYLDEKNASFQGNYKVNAFTLEQLQRKARKQVEESCEGEIVFPKLKNVRTGEELEGLERNPMLALVNGYDEAEKGSLSQDIYVYGELGSGKIYFIKDFLQKYGKGVLFINLSRVKMDDENPSFIHEVIKNSNYKGGGFNLDINSLIDYVLERPLSILFYGLEAVGEEKLQKIVEEIKMLSYYTRIVILSRKHNLINKILLDNTKDALALFEHFEIVPYEREKVQRSLEGIVQPEFTDDKILSLIDSPSKVRYFIALVTGGKAEELKRKINNSGDLLFCYLFASEFNSVSAQCKGIIRKKMTETYFLKAFEENIDRMFALIAKWAYCNFIGKEMEIDVHSFNYLENFSIMKQGATGHEFIRDEYKEYFIAYHLANTLIGKMQRNEPVDKDMLAELKHFKNQYSILQFVGYYLVSEGCDGGVYRYLLNIVRNDVQYYYIATLVYLIVLLSGKAPSVVEDFEGVFTYIEEDTFRNTGLFREIVVPNSVKRIERAAFVNLTRLERIQLGNGVETVAPWAIIKCSDLKTIEIGKALKEVTAPMITSCNALTEIKVHKLNENFADKKTYTSGLVSKDLTTFYFACPGLAEISIPEQTTTVLSWAFKGMEKLTSLHIPAALTKIDTDFTDECPSLTEFTVSPENTEYSVLDGCMLVHNKEGRRTLFRLASGVEGRFEVPSTIEAIGADAISTCRKLTEIYIPDSVERIGSYALADLQNVTRIEFEDLDCLEKTGNFILMCHNDFLEIHSNGEMIELVDFTVKARTDTDNEFKSDKIAFCADKSFDALLRQRADIETYYGHPDQPSGFAEIEIYRYVDLYRGKAIIVNNYNVLLIGMVEYNYFVGDPKQSKLQEIKDVLKRLSINCIIITRDLPCPRELRVACEENGISIYRSKRGTSAIPQIIHNVCKGEN